MPGVLEAISLGYFSLGQQRKVTRAFRSESAAGNGGTHEIHNCAKSSKANASQRFDDVGVRFTHSNLRDYYENVVIQLL
jgi:hypothetical protein